MNVSSAKDIATVAIQSGTVSPSVTAKTASGSKPVDQQEAEKPAAAPTPLRFPWLSRLSAQLEQAANKPSPYGTAPVIGDNLNEAA